MGNSAKINLDINFICVIFALLNKKSNIMKNKKWFLTKVIYDILSQEMVEAVDLTAPYPMVMATFNENKRELVNISQVLLPKVTTPQIGEYLLGLTFTYADGERVTDYWESDSFDEAKIYEIARATYDTLSTPAYKTFEEYRKWEEEKYKNIF